MTSPDLENLVRLGHLKRASCSQREFDNLTKSGVARLADAANPALSIEGRFDLAYNAAHALALAALRHRGYRSENRYIVFQALERTVGLPSETWRVLAKAHERRNLAEYEGTFDVDERLVKDVLAAAHLVLKGVKGLPPLEPPDCSLS
jgi:hypothetical protein